VASLIVNPRKGPGTKGCDSRNPSTSVRRRETTATTKKRDDCHGTNWFCHQHEVNGEQLSLPPPSSPFTSGESPCPSLVQSTTSGGSASPTLRAPRRRRSRRRARGRRRNNMREAAAREAAAAAAARAAAQALLRRLLRPLRRPLSNGTGWSTLGSILAATGSGTPCTGMAARPTRSQGALSSRRSSTTTTTPAPSQSASGATSAGCPTAPPTTPPPTTSKTHAAPALLALLTMW